MDNIEKDENIIDSDFTLSSIEKDAIGEIMNISMGSAATAISTMLDRKVSITTPEVTLTKSSEYEFEVFEPAVCTEIKYLEGLDGSNIMVMKLSDVKAIVGIIIGEDSSEEEGLNEMHLSAIGEIMNQMMGSSSTALASFLGHDINISIPDVYELNKVYENIKRMSLGNVVVVKFRFKIEGVFDSEFVSLLPIDFTKDIVKKALNANDPTNSSPKPAEIKAPPAPVRQEQRQEQSQAVPAERTAPAPAPAPKQQQVNVKPLKLGSFEEDTNTYNKEYTQPSFDLIMDVPLEITVEIGHARKLVKDILEIRQGNIIELDKQAGDPVDIIVNGQLLARGDVVVVDDNFGVRITEIISNKDFSDNKMTQTE